MNISDIKSLRELQSGTIIVPAGSGNQAIIGSSPRRVGLIFWPPSSGTITLFPKDSVTIFQGIVLSPISPPLKLTVYEHGDLVVREWRGIFDLVHFPGWPGVVDYWQVTASGGGAAVSVAKAAVAGRTHWVAGASFGGVPSGPAMWRILDGGTVICRGVHANYGQPIFGVPLKGSVGNAVSGETDAIAGMTITTVSLNGFSTDPQTMAVTEVMG